jgi:hypothetical protein
MSFIHIPMHKTMESKIRKSKTRESKMSGIEQVPGIFVISCGNLKKTMV